MTRRASNSRSNSYSPSPIHTTSVPTSQESRYRKSIDPKLFTTLTNSTNMSNTSPNETYSYWSSPYVSPRITTASSSAWSVHDRELSPKWSSPDSPVPRSQYHYDYPISPLPAPRPRQSLTPCIPLPSQIGHRGEFILHPSLLHPSETSEFEIVDLASAQHFVRARTAAYTSQPSYLAAPATIPHLPSLTIVHPSLPWCITVHHSRAEYVTVADVLYALGRNLQIPLDREWAEVVSRQSRTARDSMRNRATIRMDMLSGKTIFAGLSKSNTGTETWELHVR